MLLFNLTLCKGSLKMTDPVEAAMACICKAEDLAAAATDPNLEITWDLNIQAEASAGANVADTDAVPKPTVSEEDCHRAHALAALETSQGADKASVAERLGVCLTAAGCRLSVERQNAMAAWCMGSDNVKRCTPRLLDD
jgi:hypothetical protein